MGQRLPPMTSLIPDPGLGIDRFADGAQQAERTQVVLLRPFGAPFHERADRRGRGVEDRYAVLLDDAPEAVRLGEVGRAFVHEARRAVRQRAIDHVAVPVTQPMSAVHQIHVLVAQIEDVFGRVSLV